MLFPKQKREAGRSTGISVESDLESGGGFATYDLSELMEVELPENVNDGH